jgi:hypothetical protein
VFRGALVAIVVLDEQRAVLNIRCGSEAEAVHGSSEDLEQGHGAACRQQEAL